MRSTRRTLVLLVILAGLLGMTGCDSSSSSYTPLSDLIPEGEAPTILSVTPGDGAVNVPINTSITVTFSTSMDIPLSTTGTLQGISGTITYHDADHTATITPSVPLAYSTKYTLTIPKGVVNDISGNPLREDYTWSFTTQSRPFLVVPGTIHEMTAGGDNGHIFAYALEAVTLDVLSKKLYTIDPVAQRIVNTVDLPGLWLGKPVGLCYSPADDRVYMLSTLSGSIATYDVATDQISTMAFSPKNILSPLSYGRDIEVSSSQRRIYVLSSRTNILAENEYFLSILNLDDGTRLLEEQAINAKIFKLDEQRQRIVTLFSEDDQTTLSTYSVKGDSLILEHNRTFPSEIKHLALSPDGNHIVLANETAISVVATESLSTIVTEAVNITLHDLMFSPDGTVLYIAADTDADYDLPNLGITIRVLNIPQANDTAILGTNRDGTAVLGFINDMQASGSYMVYFYDYR